MSHSSPQEALKVLYSILDIDQKVTGLNYIKILVANLAKHLNVKHVFIGHAIEPDKSKVQTDIFWSNNNLQENFIYDLAKTPCENVLTGKRVCIYKDKVAQQFPRDELLTRINVKAYVGAPILTKKGNLSGLLVLLDDKKIEDEHFFLAVVDLISMRIDTEMERTRIEEKLRKEVSKRTVELERSNAHLNEALSQLEEANRTKDKFFSIIAHDLMSPFNVILSFSSLLVDYFDRYSKEEIKEMVSDISISSQNIYDLLENLLQWCMSQANKLECKPRMNNLNSLICNSVSLHQSNADKKEINISTSLPEGLTAFFDEDMITTVLRNLISNAIKFTHPGGKVEIQGISSDKHVQVSVKDNGVGMNNDNIKSLFKVDERYSTKGTSGEEGTGLGIILCKEFIEKNDGTFHIESKPEKGSTFSFKLPVSEES